MNTENMARLRTLKADYEAQAHTDGIVNGRYWAREQASSWRDVLVISNLDSDVDSVTLARALDGMGYDPSQVLMDYEACDIFAAAFFEGVIEAIDQVDGPDFIEEGSTPTPEPDFIDEEEDGKAA